MAAPKGIDWDNVSELGKTTDREVGEKYGVSKASVYLARKRRGIQMGSSRVSGIAWDNVPELGKISDVEIGEIYGVDSYLVGCARRHRGIPARTVSCSVCGEPVRFYLGSGTPACKLCSYRIQRAKMETNNAKLIICIAKSLRLANLTEEKILKYKEKMNGNHE